MVGSEEGSDSFSDDDDSESGDDSGSEEVEEVSPSRTEGRFRKQHDPALDRGRVGVDNQELQTQSDFDTGAS